MLLLERTAAAAAAPNNADVGWGMGVELCLLLMVLHSADAFT